MRIKKSFALMLSAVVIVVMTIPASSEAGGRRHSRTPDIGDVVVGLGVMAAVTVAAVAINQVLDDGCRPHPRAYDRGYRRDYDRMHRNYRRDRHRRTEVVIVVPPGGRVRIDGRYRWSYRQ